MTSIVVVFVSNNSTIRFQSFVNSNNNCFTGEKPNLLSLLSFHNEIGHINILQQVGKKYCSFGVLLLNDETGAKIKAIASECHGDPEQIILEIVKQWMEGKGRPISWDVLINVLNDIGLTTLARDIEEEIHH